MTTALPYPRPARFDPECQLLDHLVRTFDGAGMQVTPHHIIHLYVSLKSRPLVLLVGPPRSGKVRAIELTAQMLMGQAASNCQMMTGHAWFASGSRNIGLVTGAQAHLNDEKIAGLVEEAANPHNTARLFLACLRRISRAEVDGLFSMLAYQLRHKELIRLPTLHLEAPMPYPPNLILVGTLDTDLSFQIDTDLLASTSLVCWDGAMTAAKPPTLPAFNPHYERLFLSACVRGIEAARRKLHRLGVSEDIAHSLQGWEAMLLRVAVEGITIYLANSWSDSGTGLFHPSAELNLATALRFAISQGGADAPVSKANQPVSAPA